MLVYNKQFMKMNILDNHSHVDQVNNLSFRIYTYPLS